MPFRFVDHTGDVGFELEGTTLADLLSEAVAAFACTLTDRERLGSAESREIELAAPAPDLLLHALLEELLYLFERDGFLAREGRVELAGERPWRLRARLAGECRDPQRLPLKLLVKGITYHQLAVEEREGGFHGRVLLDI